MNMKKINSAFRDNQNGKDVVNSHALSHLQCRYAD
jgi:hypothetical protein